MSFSELLEVALAGTLRQEPPAVLAEQETMSAESRLLRGASYEGMRRLAGRRLERLEGGLPIEPAKTETSAEIPPAAAVRLAEILEARPELLPEWLQLAVGRNLRVPPLGLPDLLEYARAEPDSDLRELIMRVGGERMAWLAGLNPDWRFAAHTDPEQQLMLGSPEDRPNALRRIRCQDPTRGRELLQDRWASERGDARPKLLDAMATRLSEEDEPFLDQAIRDSRKEARETVLRLIRRIPNARFGQRWSDRARQVFSLKKGLLRGDRLEIREPAGVAPEWIADGLDPRPPKGIGTIAWILQQVLALTPPSTWPRTMLNALDRTDWPITLLIGMAEAARAYGDGAWSEDLLMRWVSSTNLQKNASFNARALFASLDAQRAENVLRHVLDVDPPLVASLSGVRAEPWSLDLSRFVVQHLASWFGKQRYPLAPFIREATFLLDPRVLQEAERMLDAEIEPIWARASVDRLLQTLDYRLAMRKELAD